MNYLHLALLARLLAPALFALVFSGAAIAQNSLSQGQSPATNFAAHAQNKCPNEWRDYQADKRQQAHPITTDPAGLPNGAPEGTASKPYDGGQGVSCNPLGFLFKQRCKSDQAGQAQQCALSVPQGGPRPVTSTAPDMSKTDPTQPFMRPAALTGSEAKRTTLDCRFKRNADPLGSTLAISAPAVNAEHNGTQLWSNLPCTSNGASAAVMSAFGDQYLSASTNPAANALKAKADQQIKNMQNSDNQGNCAQQNCKSSFESMTSSLINVANEEAAEPTNSEASYKSESNVIWMVQQMYKKCYVQMAILFLLPGAIITQAKSMVSFGLLNTQDEDTASPFIGIIRAIMAIFLIPATQLTVSYCIDIGNAVTDPVARQVQVGTLMNWVSEQAYTSNPANQDNCIKNYSGKRCQGKLMGTPASQVVQERQSDLTVGVQNALNTINALMSQGLNVLNGFQLVMMCYLFLLGPIAAAFYAWPTSIGRDLFRKAFASWLDGVIVLSLWKFWWCIVLLCMAVRLNQGVDPTSQYEMYYYTAFMGILVMVPFQPFEFRPGEVVSQVLERAQQQGGGGGAGGGGSGGGAQGSGARGSSQTGAASGGAGSGTAAQNQANSMNTSGDEKLSVASRTSSGGTPAGEHGSSEAKMSAELPAADNKFDVAMDPQDVKQPPTSGEGPVG